MSFGDARRTATVCNRTTDMRPLSATVEVTDMEHELVMREAWCAIQRRADEAASEILQNHANKLDEIFAAIELSYSRETLDTHEISRPSTRSSLAYEDRAMHEAYRTIARQVEETSDETLTSNLNKIFTAIAPSNPSETDELSLTSTQTSSEFYEYSFFEDITEEDRAKTGKKNNSKVGLKDKLRNLCKKVRRALDPRKEYRAEHKYCTEEIGYIWGGFDEGKWSWARFGRSKMGVCKCGEGCL
jgi:hypothetical protein